MKTEMLGLLAAELVSECDATTERGMRVKKRTGLGVLLGVAVIAATASAAPPAKQTTVSVPVVVDSAGTIVGPVVPIINNDGLGRPTGTSGLGLSFDVAALYRSGGESGKIWFGGPEFPGSTADFRDLQLLGPFSLRFRETGCQGQAYIDRPQIGFVEGVDGSYSSGVLGRDLRGYGPLLVYPRAPGQTTPPFTPTLFRIDWSQPVTADPMYLGASILYPDGTCAENTSFPGVLVWPVNFVNSLNLVGPFAIK